jgi:hypothetical protein
VQGSFDFIFCQETTSVNCLSTSVKRNPAGFLKVHTSHISLTDKAAMQTEENLLQAEIEFWRYMIESRRGTISEQATERMLNACELAERKLMLMTRRSSVIETWQ